MLMKKLEKPQPTETEIKGNWIEAGGRVVGDAACERVQILTDTYFEKIGKDWSGWETLFRDPEDGRYWERTYPHGELHGGGPPALYYLPEDKAREKYSQLF